MGSKYTEQEMAQITADAGKDLSKAMAKFAPDWKVTKCGEEMDPGLKDEVRGKKNVLVTHPLSETVGCVISRTVDLPANQVSTLKLVVGHDPRGDWDLIVKANGRQLLRMTIGPENLHSGLDRSDCRSIALFRPDRQAGAGQRAHRLAFRSRPLGRNLGSCTGSGRAVIRPLRGLDGCRQND